MAQFPQIALILTGLGLIITGAWRHDTTMTDTGLALVFAGSGIATHVRKRQTPRKK